MEKPLLLIIGMGPAGLAASIFLRKLGFPVLAVDRSPAPKLKIGESLPPNAQALLEQLGIWRAFQEGHHLKCFGNKSAWGSDQVVYHDFIRQPPGHGWHIDRMAFEQLLLHEAQRLGVQTHWTSRIDAVQWINPHWEVTLNHNNTLSNIQSSFIIDASGRNSWLARQLGLERLYEDRQLALVAFLQSKNLELEDTSSLLETHQHGWWYSAKIPHQKLATAFFCQANTAQKAAWTKPEEWWSLVQTSPQTHHRLQSADFELLDSPHFVSADSGILEKLYGPGWIAVGDAAMTYDPIASHGLMMAMLSSRDAAQAIQSHFAGNTQALITFQDRLFQAFQIYQQQRKGFYQMEKRFGEADYWRGRR